MDLSNAVKGCMPSVVTVFAPSTDVFVNIRRGVATKIDNSGSGFLIDHAGHIITNHHVVKPEYAKHITVVFADGQKHQATYVGGSLEADIAVLRIKPFEGMKPANMSLIPPEWGQEVFAIGCPNGNPFSVNKGIVSHPWRFNLFRSVLPFLQTDAAITLGSSGGPLFDAEGNVIAVNTFIQTTMVTTKSYSGEEVVKPVGSIGLGFALHIDGAYQTAQKIIYKQGDISPGTCGLMFAEPSAEQQAYAQEPAPITEFVQPFSEAARAGFKSDDRILSIDGVEISSSYEAQAALFLKAATGQRCSILVERNTLSIKKNLTLEMTFP